MTARLGLTPLVVVALAMLGVPRAVAHDLALVGPAVNAVLVFLPPVVWLAVALARRVPNPLLTLTAVGVCHGVLLGLTHQLLWAHAFPDEPALGGALAGALDPGAATVVLRVFAFVSSLVTGAAVGAATGAVGWVLGRVGRRSP